MLIQPKFNSKYGYNCIQYQGPRLWNGVVNEFKLAENFNECSLECRCSYCDMCVLCVQFYVHIRSLFCKYFIFVSENSLMANVLYCIISEVK